MISNNDSVLVSRYIIVLVGNGDETLSNFDALRVAKTLVPISISAPGKVVCQCLIAKVLASNRVPMSMAKLGLSL